MRPARHAAALAPFTVVAVGGLAAVVLGAVCLAAGCATTRSAFPSAAAIEELASNPPPVVHVPGGGVHVDRWELGGPFPAGFGGGPDALPAPWNTTLAQAGEPLLTTEGLQCFARELAVFLARRSGPPPDGLRAFMAARCGVVAVGHQVSWVTVDVAETTPDAEVVAGLGDDVRALLAGPARDGAGALGIGFARDARRAVVAVVRSRSAVELQAAPAVAGPDGSVRLEGRVRGPVERVEAMVTVGETGARPCTADAAVALPAFRFRCEPAPEDAVARVEIFVWEPGRLLGSRALDVAVAASAAPATTWTRRDIGPAQPVTTAEELEREVGRLVNVVRAGAELAPLGLSPKQSWVARRLVPHFLASTFGTAPRELADVVSLGIMAGWKVDGFVGRGDFVSMFLAGGQDAAALVSDELDSPFTRRVFLDPDASVLALGAQMGREAEVPWVALLVGTYALVAEVEPAAAEERLFEWLTRERANRGLGAPARLEGIADLTDEAAAELEAGLRDPSDAADALLRDAVQRLRRPATVWYFEAADLASLTFDEQLAADPDAAVAFAAARYRPDGEPWARWAVLLLAAEP